MQLKSNNDYDMEFKVLHNTLLQMETPDDFDIIFDFAKRLLNEYGFSVKFIKMIYLLGYLEKQKEEK
jgi:hypothetical protein